MPNAAGGKPVERAAAKAEEASTAGKPQVFP